MADKYRAGNNAAPNHDRVVCIVDRGHWMDRAACRGADVTLFFEPDNEREESRYSRIDAAKEICWQCEVSAQCLETALRNHEAYGIWGGFTTSERERIARGSA